MDPILFIDRKTQEINEEKVYFKEILYFLYGKSWPSKLFGQPLLYAISRFPLFSSLFGWWNKQSFTKTKILPFIKKYSLDPSEFLQPIDNFHSFNEFFIRKLKPECRPIAPGTHKAIIPADGRYLFYPDISKEGGFLIKGEKFSLEELLKDHPLAKTYERSSMVIARLCPTDYHRYHFPVDCTPSEAKLINGYLYSVNPVAIKQDIHIMTKNKRVICHLDAGDFGNVLFIEVGATSVGSIHQTYTPKRFYHKGEEKGYFSFGASTLILLFEPDRIQFDQDLIQASENRMEIRCLMGQSMGMVCG